MKENKQGCMEVSESGRFTETHGIFTLRQLNASKVFSTLQYCEVLAS